MSKHKQTPTQRAARAIAQRLESHQQAGVTHARKAAAPPKQPAAKQPPTAKRPATAKQPPSPPVPLPLAGEGGRAAKPAPVQPAPVATDDRVAALAALAKKVSACTRCSVLAKSRTQTVFGVGNLNARLVFCGEAPGADEDRQGEPFVGRAGQLLNKIIAACGMRREDVYILNIIKCRPPENRTPLPTEAANCREYLDAQLRIIRPEFICCLGACAAQNLLGTTTSIGKMRGLVYNHEGIKVVCTYHPAYLLRNPEMKRATWEDMQFLLGEMGLEVPKTS